MDRFVIRGQKPSNSSIAGTSASNSNVTSDLDTTTTSSSLPSFQENTKLTEPSDPPSRPSSQEKSPVSPVSPVKKKKKIYKQKFRNLWKEEYNFIIFNKVADAAYCKICNLPLQGGKFHIKRHAKSRQHILKFNAAESTPQINKVFKCNETLTLEKQIRQMEIKVVSFLCKNNLPFTLADELVHLIKECVAMPDAINSIHLKRQKATQLVVGVLGPWAKNHTVEKLRNEKFSLIIDETTDVGIKKNLVINARFYDHESKKVEDHFVDLIEVKDSTAESLFLSLKTFLIEKNIPFNNVIAFGADNANVMMGNFNSVQQKLSQLIEGIVVQGCSCHSLHLVASHASKQLPNTVEQFVRDIYNYFSNSAKRSEELKECQVFVQEKPKKMLHPSQTRWLSLKAVCDRVLEHWNSLTLYFQRAALEDHLPSAISILNSLHNPLFKLYLQFLSFNLEKVTQLNIEFQSENSKIPGFLHKIMTLYKSILRCFVKKSLIDATSNVDIDKINLSNPNNYLNIDKIYFGGKVDAYLKDQDNLKKIDKSELHSFKLRCLEFYVEYAKQIKKRFNFQDKHLKFASLFTPENALSGNTFSISEYSNLFPSLQNLDIDKVNFEWQLLPEIEGLNNYTDLSSFWYKVKETKNENGNYMFSNVFEVVKCVLILPHSSASAERIFSQLNIIKNRMRNRLLVNTCSNIIAIKDFLSHNSSFPLDKTDILKDVRNVEIGD